MGKDSRKEITFLLALLVIVISLSISGCVDQNEPGFEVSDLEVSEMEIGAGKEVTIRVDVTNNGDSEGSYTVELDVDDETEATETVELGPGDSKEVSFEFSRETTGTYELSVGDFSETVEVLEPVEFEVIGLSATPSEVEPNETVEISANVENVGQVSGEKTMELMINGEVEETREVQIDEGKIRAVTFEVTKEEPQTYSVNLGDKSASFEVIDSADFEVSDLEIEEEVTLGETLNGSIMVENTGETERIYQLVVYVDGEPLINKGFTYPPKESAKLNFWFVPEKTGNHSVKVDDFKETVYVAPIKEKINASFTSSIVNDSTVEEVTNGIFNQANQSITLNKIEYFEETGELRNTITSDQIINIWGEQLIEAGDSMIGTVNFKKDKPTIEEIKDWEFRYYCETQQGTEFNVSAEYVETNN